MVAEGIVLGHEISKSGIEMNKAKVELISKLPTPTTVEDVRSFLGHTGFYRRFTKNFSLISRPLCRLLEHEKPFNFDQECEDVFEKLKEALTTASITIESDWTQPFELMCDASDFVIGEMLAQKKGRVIPYLLRKQDYERGLGDLHYHGEGIVGDYFWIQEV